MYLTLNTCAAAMTAWLVSLPPTLGKGRCRCKSAQVSLSVYSGRVDEHSRTESLLYHLLLLFLFWSSVPLALFLIPGHNLRAGWHNSLSVPQDTHKFTHAYALTIEGWPSKKKKKSPLAFSLDSHHSKIYPLEERCRE